MRTQSTNDGRPKSGNRHAATVVGAVLAWIVVIGVLLAAAWGVTAIIGLWWGAMKGLGPTTRAQLLTTLLTAVLTALAAVTTVMIGRYYERKKEREATLHDKQVTIYDDFLKGLFETFYEANTTPQRLREERAVTFLRDWQRRFLLWGESSVFSTYLSWRNALRTDVHTAQSLFALENLILEMRSSLGHTRTGVPRGSVITMIMRRPDIFLSMAAANPNVTLAEVAEEERRAEAT